VVFGPALVTWTIFTFRHSIIDFATVPAANRRSGRFHPRNSKPTPRTMLTAPWVVVNPMLASLPRLLAGICDYFGGISLSEAANSVLVPAFSASTGELLVVVVVNSSALFTRSALFVTVSAADPLRATARSVATALVSALARCCLRASLRPTAQAE